MYQAAACISPKPKLLSDIGSQNAGMSALAEGLGSPLSASIFSTQGMVGKLPSLVLDKRGWN